MVYLHHDIVTSPCRSYGFEITLEGLTWTATTVAKAGSAGGTPTDNLSVSFQGEGTCTECRRCRRRSSLPDRTDDTYKTNRRQTVRGSGAEPGNMFWRVWCGPRVGRSPSPTGVM